MVMLLFITAVLSSVVRPALFSRSLLTLSVLVFLTSARLALIGIGSIHGFLLILGGFLTMILVMAIVSRERMFHL